MLSLVFASQAYAAPNATAECNSTAPSGALATQCGVGADAATDGSTAIGRDATVLGLRGTAIGWQADAGDAFTTALGALSNASNSHATAIGV